MGSLDHQLELPFEVLHPSHTFFNMPFAFLRAIATGTAGGPLAGAFGLSLVTLFTSASHLHQGLLPDRTRPSTLVIALHAEITGRPRARAFDFAVLTLETRSVGSPVFLAFIWCVSHFPATLLVWICLAAACGWAIHSERHATVRTLSLRGHDIAAARKGSTGDGVHLSRRCYCGP